MNRQPPSNFLVPVNIAKLKDKYKNHPNRKLVEKHIDDPKFKKLIQEDAIRRQIRNHNAKQHEMSLPDGRERSYHGNAKLRK